MKAFKKVTNKISNSKIIKNPVFLLIGLIVIILVIALLYFIFLKYSPIMNFKYEGYAISGKDITENLLGSSEDSTINKNLELAKIEEQGTIFKKLNDYFVGNKEKTEINLNYPIYINENSAIYNLAENSTLISKDFEEIAGYPNLSIAQGKVYDGNNLERADAKEYIFVKTSDDIFINLYEIKIKTTANEYTIPVNSIVAFNENTIRYYSVNNNILVFNEINDVDSDSDVQMVEKSYTYEELLTRLGILQDESNNTENSNSQENIIQENTTNEEVTNDKENIDNDQQNEDSDMDNQNQNGYIKPEVTVDNFTAEVYTAKSTLHIKDPSGRIVEAPTFEIYKDGKIYLRRTFSNSDEIQITGLIPDTEYEIVGKYVYLNENGQKVENTFYEGSFTTKGYEELGSIEITKENGEIYSNKIQLTKVKITSDLNAEAIKGINQVEIETGEIRTVLKNSQVNELLQGKEITIESSEGLKSNSKIEYAIKFYDKNRIELKVNNNIGETRTSKEAPVARVSIKEQDIVSVTLRLNLTNKDNVELENYKYVVTRPNGEVVQEKRLAENETELLLEDLDQNQYYKIGIYADYDLNDNKGKQENVEIGNLVFATQPISTLGSLELTVENKELTSTTSTISYKINEERTDKRLIQILNELTINIIEQPSSNEDNSADDEESREGTVVYTYTLTGEEITNLQQAGTKEIKYENLKSNTKYIIEITGNVELGKTQESIPVTYNYKEFTTLKIPAKVEIKNQFVTGNLIDFDVRIEDIDNAVLNNKVRMELRNSSNDLIDLQEITTNEDYIRKTYEKLEENKTYKLSFYADQYNEGSTDETYKVNYLIKEIEIITEPGISGSIGLTELTREATGKNLVDMSSETKWYVYPNFNTYDYYGKEYNEETKILKLGGNNNYGRAVYDLREYVGQEVTMSFKAKAGSNSQNAYIQNSKKDTNRTKIEGLTTEWEDFKYTLTVDSTGYLGFYIDGGNGIEIKELQIELGNKKTSYEEFKYILQSNYSINLEDKRNEITTNDYYIKIYEDDKLKIEDRYEEIPEDNIITNKIKKYTIETKKKYNVKLSVKIRDREYILSELEYNTQDTEEIKGIYTVEEFREIQPKGHYIVLKDINLAEGTGGRINCFGWNYKRSLIFEGNINFNGNKLITDYENDESIFSGIAETGVIENIILEVRLNNELEINDFYGLVNVNYGTIKNIVVNLTECSQVQNQNICLIGDSNYGTIENFIINNSTPLYGNSNLTMGVENNYGTIKNGYIYGENIEIKGNLLSNNRNVGGLVINSSSRAMIKNVYSLIKINFESQNSEKNEGVGNIIKTNFAEVNNIYSVESGNTIDYNHGPTIAYNTGKVNNAYYFSEKLFKNNYNLKTTRLALYDNTFQNQMLNDEEKWDIDDLLKMKCYPQLIMPECMPNQIYINLPEIQDKDLPDVITTEVISQEADSAKVKFIISNSSADTISEIKVKNLDCKIESQNYNNGVTEVITKISNPILYVSSYSLESISTKNQFNMTYTRKFDSGERNISIEFYKEINNIDDWYQMNNSPTENYRLMKDLDFKNNQNKICIRNQLTGNIDGNNHTIKNIDNTHIFYNINKGSLKNLNISNVSFITNSTYTGIIINANSAEIDNVNVENINIEVASEDKEASLIIGGLITYANNNTTKNSSVNNINITLNSTKKAITVGGLVAKANSAYIYNCYVNNININESNTMQSNGIGAVIGYSEMSEVINCYSIGNINTDVKNVGGIIGNLTGSSSMLNYSYSLVNIEANNDNIGGIVGYDGNSDLDTNISYNLALGNIYNSKDTDNSNRCVGNAPKERFNYSYANQLIDGKKSEELLGAEKLLTYKELADTNTYYNVLLFGNSYSYSNLEKGILPKLYNTNQEGLLINQPDIEIPSDNDLTIKNLEVEKNSVNTLRGRILITNLNEVEITELTIEDMNVQIQGISLENQKTYVDFTATPIRYYDSYKIDSISYLINGEEIKKNLNAKLDIQFFKDIYNYHDWQSIEIGTYQNYRLMGDIDFSGRNDVKLDVTIGRLDGNNKKIKNLDINLDGRNSGLIYMLRNSMDNVIFENISIINTVNTNYIGIIVKNTAEINNLKCTQISIEDKENITGTGRGIIALNDGEISNLILDNITLKCIGSDKVGTVGENYNNEKKISNINAKDIKCFGKSYVGSICGLKGNIIYANVEKIYIEAMGDYVGGIAGYLDTQNDNISITNVVISGKNYVGGLFGDAGGKLINGDDIEVYGKNYVGGIFGQMQDGIDRDYILIKDSNIEGTENYIGGIAGTSSDAYGAECYVNNCEIKAESINSNYVGGIFGEYTGVQNMNNRIIVDSSISGNSSSVGGITGYYNGNKLYGGVVYNTTIKGKENIGGIVGQFRKGELYLSYADCEIYGDTNLGGIAGYLDNTDMTAAVNTSKIHECYTVSKLTGNTNVGGLLGDSYNNLYEPEKFYYSNYVDIDIISNKLSNTSVGIAGKTNQNQYLKDTYYYKYSTINGENPSTQNEIFISLDKYLTEEDLKEQTTYTSRIKWETSKWNFSVLANNKYPILNYSSLIEQEGIDLPKDAEHILKNANTSIISDNENKQEEPEQSFEYADKTIQTYSTYSVITAEDGSQVTRNTKLYLKDNNLYAIPIVITDGQDLRTEEVIPVANNFILDSYNGKQYETVLGSDGKLYDLKEPIEYPENFVNADIESIGNNLKNDLHEVEVIYKNGDKIKFNYQTGEVISSSKAEDAEKTGLFDYLKEKISEIENSSSGVTEEISNKYEESKELQNKLEKTPVEEAIEKQNIANAEQEIGGITTTENNVTNNSLTENKYISMYNEETGQYEIYNEEELLDTTKEEVVSENEKIEANNLSEYYASEGETKNTKMGIVWIVISIIGVGIILFVLRKNLKKKNA